MPTEPFNSWNWRNRSRRVIVLRQLVPVISSTVGFPLANPGVTFDCYNKIETLRKTYEESSNRLRALIEDCKKASREYLQSKLYFIATGNVFYSDQMNLKSSELQNLHTTKEQLQNYINILYSDILSSTC